MLTIYIISSTLAFLSLKRIFKPLQIKIFIFVKVYYMVWVVNTIIIDCSNKCGLSFFCTIGDFCAQIYHSKLFSMLKSDFKLSCFKILQDYNIKTKSFITIYFVLLQKLYFYCLSFSNLLVELLKNTINNM